MGSSFILKTCICRSTICETIFCLLHILVLILSHDVQYVQFVTFGDRCLISLKVVK